MNEKKEGLMNILFSFPKNPEEYDIGINIYDDIKDKEKTEVLVT